MYLHVSNARNEAVGPVSDVLGRCSQAHVLVRSARPIPLRPPCLPCSDVAKRKFSVGLDVQSMPLSTALMLRHPVLLAQVPNVKNVQERSMAGIAGELARLQAAAAAGRLKAEDLAGGTLTVSNIGAIGGTYATPLVNVPEVAIVALGRCPAYPALEALCL